MRDDPPPAKVAFLLISGFSMISYAAAAECFRAANHLSETKLYDLRHLQIDRQDPIASNGVQLRCDGGLGTIGSFDFIFVCASDEAATFKDPKTFAWLRSQARRGAVIGGLGGGAYILGHAGLLDGRRVTLHWAYAAAFAEAFPSVDLRRSLYEIDTHRMTCGGGMAPLDMIHDLFLRRHGERIAMGVSDWFLHTEIRQSRSAHRLPLEARLGVHHPGLISALRAMDLGIEEPLSRAQLAAIAGMSERHLDRLFLAQVGTAMRSYYIRLRLEKARSLISQSGMSLVEVAMASGFASASTFSKAYRRVFNVPPSAERRIAGSARFAGESQRKIRPQSPSASLHDLPR